MQINLNSHFFISNIFIEFVCLLSLYELKKFALNNYQTRMQTIKLVGNATNIHNKAVARLRQAVAIHFVQLKLKR